MEETRTEADFLSDFLEPFHFELERRQEMIDAALARRFGGRRDGSVVDVAGGGAVVDRAKYTHLRRSRGARARHTHTRGRQRYDERHERSVGWGAHETVVFSVRDRRTARAAGTY